MGSKLLGMVLFCWACCGVGQEARPRLAGVPMGVNRAVLVGSRTPHALRGEDVGAVAPETVIPGITLVFKRTAAQEEALLALLAAQQDTASPLYHQWLTPHTFATRFGMAAADVAAAESWLRAQGFEVEGVARGRDRITFTGSAGQVQAAFGAELRQYQVEGERHFAPAADLTLPVELASVTAAVLHLSDFRPQPSAAVVNRVKAEYTTGSTQTHYLSPTDVLTMYDVAFPASSQLNLGYGQSLAVVGQSFVDVGSGSAISRLRQVVKAFGPVSAVLVPGSGVEAISPGDQGESELDLEYSTGVAGQASAFLVYVGANRNYNVFDALSYAITEDIAPVVSISYGECESLLSAAELDQGNALFAQAAAQGQTLVASSGDSGSTGCAPYSTSSGVTVAQQQALAVEFPANSPYVTAVGGTQMAPGTSSAGPNTYWFGSSGGGPVVGSLLSYVPEVTWNEGSSTRGIVAGGGGSSAYYPRPAWQTGVQGLAAGSYRLLPDVAFQASIQSPGYLVCTDDPALLGGQSAQANCQFLLGTVDGHYTVAGGTSFAAPIFAGMVAILNQTQNATGQGNLNPVLYGLASNPSTYTTVFHDITSGTIACTAGEGSCAAPGESGFAATPGYDEATGLGSVDFGKLIAAWPPSRFVALQGTNLAVFLHSTQGTAADLTLEISLATGSSYGATAPTGTMSIAIDGTVVQPKLAVTDNTPVSGTASYSFTPPLTAGSHLAMVSYAGDPVHAPSVATASFLVGNVLPSGSFSLAAGNLTVANGGTGTDVVTVTPGGGYSGRVVWALSVASSTNAALTACYSIHSPAVNGTSTATLKMGVGSACGPAAAAKEGQMLRLGAALEDERFIPWGEPLAVSLAGLLVCGSFAVRRRGVMVPRLSAMLVIALASLHLSGCGGAKSASGDTAPSPPPPPVAATATYTMMLKATDSVNGAIAASTTFTLTVD